MRNDHEYLFIDGRYLHETLDAFSKKYFDNRKVLLDSRMLTLEFQKTFYYDCDPVKRVGESDQDFEFRKSELESFESNLANLPGVHIYKGAIRGMGKKTRQKGVDVALAVDLLTHSYRKNIHRATLIAGDLDFLPLVEALVLDGLYVTLWFCPERTSKELINAVDGRKILTINSIYQFLESSFCESNPPAPQEVRRIRFEGRTPLRTGVWTANGMPIELYQTTEAYELVAWDGHSKEEIVRSHPNKNLLIDFAQEQFRWGIVWSDDKCEH